MVVDKIHLSNFRNFKKKSLKFSPKTTVIVGSNASGKTNILEAIFLLSTGKSFKARVEEEMVEHGAEIARVKGVTDEKISLEVVLTRGQINIGTTREERVPRKKLLMNGVSRRLFNFSGQFRVVLFDPWTLDLVTESPARRRKFLDSVLTQVDREYYRATLSYEKGLRRRNKILLRIREEGISRSSLMFWDKLLIKNGDYIGKKRAEFISFTNETASLGDQDFSVVYDKSAISESRLEQYKREEVAAASTLVGPHRDDFVVKLKRDLAKYGSRGEQRMAVLWLKLAELLYIENETGEKPTLLLDDIFSELDSEHRKVVTAVVGRGQQIIITTADKYFVKGFKGVEKVTLKP